MKEKMVCLLAVLIVGVCMSACSSIQEPTASRASFGGAAESFTVGNVACQTRLLKPAARPADTPKPKSESSSAREEDEISATTPTKAIGILERKLKTTDYGGVYMRGDSVVVLAVNKASVLKVINDNNLDHAVTVLPAKYSVKQLKSTYASLEKGFDRFDMTSIATLVMENRVEIVVADYSAELKAFIKSLKYSGCVKVVISNQPEEPI